MKRKFQNNKNSKIVFSFGYISIAFLCGLAVMFPEKFVPYVLCVAIHELGHIAVIMYCGYETLELSFKVMRIDMIDFSKNMRPYSEQAMISIAGPLANIVTALIFNLIYINTNIEFFGVCNIISEWLCFFNIVPMCGTDGGELLEIFLNEYFDCGTVSVLMRICTAVFGLLMLYLAVSSGKTLF